MAEADALDESNVKALFERRLCAIRVKQYCPADVAKETGRRIRNNSPFETWQLGDRGEVSTGVSFGMGIPRQQAQLSNRNAKLYGDKALTSVRKMRDAFAPHLSPIDRLRLELDELWPGGANVSTLGGRKCAVGIVRMMKPDSFSGGRKGYDGICHVDGTGLKKIFSANIYLDVPSEGGELKIWNFREEKKELYEKIHRALSSHAAFDPDIQEMLQEKLPEPISIYPKRGDLILLDTSRPHAVAGFVRGYRLTVQTFLELPKKHKNRTVPAIKVFS